MAYKNVKYGDYRERRNFSRIRNTYELKDLLEIQKKSYEKFINFGIKEVFEDLFPVENFSGTLSLEFGDYHFDEPRYSIKESKDRETTYSAPLRVEVRLLNRETGEVKEQEIFMGDMPMMTESGTFVINGAERVIVSQLVRSPSVYFNREVDKNGRELITSQIIPTRGTWLEFEVDARDVLYVRIDRTRKVTLTTLLRAFGLSSDDQILSMFGEDDYLKNTIAKDSTKNTDEALIEIYEKLRPGEPATLDSSKNQIITRFFDEFRYDLARVGRYKFNRKLNVADRLLNQTLAEDVCDADGVIVLEKGTQITKANLDVLKAALNAGFGLQEVTVNDELDIYNKVQVIKIVDPTDKKKKLIVIGNDQSIDVKRLTISDVYASVSYYLNLLHGVGNYDEIDHLGNRRIRQVGELLQNQFRIGVSRMERVIRERMTTQEMEEVTPKTLINIRPVTAAMKEFFGSSQLSQFMDQTNPIAELTNKRRLSALGPGGLSRDRAGVEVRDVNASHYGRICPIESPEGPNIGLITSLASYAKIDEYGFIMTPYRKVVDKKITDEVVYLTADEELDYIISQSTVGTNEDNVITDDMVNARFRGDNILAKPEQVDYIDVSPQQVVSVTTSCIPFLEHDDATRALMGANMQRQAMPLIKTEAPFVGTGVEFIAAKDSGVEIICKADGVVEYVDARKIVVKTKNGKDTYRLANFELANSSICSHQRPIVHVGDKVKAGVTILADGNSTDKGELALGKNMTVAFMTFNGYNYEDAVILNENLVKDDKFTSLHLEDYEMQCRETKLGPEEITRDIPNVSEEARRNLDENGIITIGTEVKEGDILVGKVTPKGMAELTSEEKLLHAIFGEKTREVRDTSLRVPHGGDGVVHDIKIYSRKDNDELPAGVSKVIRVYIIQKRKIQVGDKMSGRHGNKGVISLILPQEDMPYMPDGTPVDIMLNPQGVPSRMNLGQILEIHMGMAAKKLGVHIATPVFDGAHIDDIQAMMKEAGMDEDGKTVLYDGRTGEAFDNRIAVGVMYMIKLHHMVDDKLHARSTGPYSLVTQQPLGGKAQFGGQRFGEMEVWALYAYGAAHTLQEMMTTKSDDVVGRVKVYESIIKGQEIDHAGVPESFRVLMKEFQALGLDVSIIDDDGKTLELKEIEEAEDKEDTKLNIDEIDKSPAVPISSSDDDDEFAEMDEEEEDADFEEELDEDLEMEEDFEEGADL
ncbi:MAG TPA: DNA-directed RNA polymerase subunit beta [Candidatus Faecimonas intestinavium]|nr:DNA-directed RNA polymerase subunit beta [Candidatus Faecimonas intestinavium]